MFGSRDGIFPRSVHHDDSPSRRCLKVDVIDPDSGTADYLEPLRSVDNISSKPCLASDNDTVILPYGRHQLAGADISIHITPDLLLPFKDFYALGGQFISHQYSVSLFLFHLARLPGISTPLPQPLPRHPTRIDDPSP